MADLQRLNRWAFDHPGADTQFADLGNSNVFLHTGVVNTPSAELEWARNRQLQQIPMFGPERAPTHTAPPPPAVEATESSQEEDDWTHEDYVRWDPGFCQFPPSRSATAEGGATASASAVDTPARQQEV